MNNYDKRWLFVLNWAKNVKALLEEGYLLFDGDRSFDKTALIIDEEKRYIGLQYLSARYLIFEGNTDYDHGAHTPIPQLRAELSDYKVLKFCDVDLFK